MQTALAEAPDTSDGDVAVVRSPRSWLGTAITWTLVGVSLFVGATLSVIIGNLAALLGDRQRRIAHRLNAFGYHCIVYLHPTYRFKLSGLENLPEGACVLCPNHQSHSDVVYLFALPLQFKWVIKKELYQVPLFGAAMRAAGYPMIDRGDPKSATALFQRVSAYLRAGIPVLSFPEGTRSVDGTLGRFQHGTTRLAALNGVPLVPVGVIGTADLLPRGSGKFPLVGRLSIHIGTPIATAEVGRAGARLLTKQLREGIIAAKRRAAQAWSAPEKTD